MQIVIDIPQEKYDAIKSNYNTFPAEMKEWGLEAIRNGAPLSKGHGRLIDADKLEPRDISPESWYSPMWGFELDDIEDAPTIIEADKEGEE